MPETYPALHFSDLLVKLLNDQAAKQVAFDAAVADRAGEIALERLEEVPKGLQARIRAVAEGKSEKLDSHKVRLAYLPFRNAAEEELRHKDPNRPGGRPWASPWRYAVFVVAKHCGIMLDEAKEYAGSDDDFGHLGSELRELVVLYERGRRVAGDRLVSLHEKLVEFHDKGGTAILLRGLWQDFPRDCGAIGLAIPGEPPNSETNPPQIDADGSRVKIDGDWRDVTETQLRIVGKLLENPGAWVGGKMLGTTLDSRPDKLIKGMPVGVRSHIDSHKTKGYRWIE